MERNNKGQFIKGGIKGFKDYTGIQKNQLTFIEFSHIYASPSGNRRPYWKVRCTCGNETVKSAYDVYSGHTKSCGCLHKTNTSKARKKHGEADTRLYYIWENMKKRCYNPKSDRYENYGARGIKVCDEWLEDYSNFSEWAHASGYEKHLTIERKDLNQNYCPENCTWITHKEQAQNRSTNKWVIIDGKKYSPIELEELYKIPVKTIYARIARGDTGENVVRPLGKRQFKKR
ncbi:hypothetical protein [Lysinibacillus capsici]|uniref:hypothetical protein n=1 Tax=Lysinibacillus capsici TaxID=2115968 RepID=UPI00289DFF88|nr:hypothetical protein [Lysinibacillus capsici]